MCPVTWEEHVSVAEGRRRSPPTSDCLVPPRGERRGFLIPCESVSGGPLMGITKRTKPPAVLAGALVAALIAGVGLASLGCDVRKQVNYGVAAAQAEQTTAVSAEEAAAQVKKKKDAAADTPKGQEPAKAKGSQTPPSSSYDQISPVL